MEKRDWGFPERIWGIEKEYDAGRIGYIYDALKKLPHNFSLVDVACGEGIIADGIQYLFPEARVSQFDIVSYQEWGHLRVKPYQMNVDDFMKRDEKYDVVMFLNSFRNWEEKERGTFIEWLKRNARYFITSGQDIGFAKETIGKDVKGYSLDMYTL